MSAARANPYRKNNPDTTLELARKAAERLRDQRHNGYRSADVDVLLDAFLDLDEHLVDGGDYPGDWEIDESDSDDGDEDDDDDDEGDDEEED